MLKRHEKINFRDILAFFHEMFTVSTNAYTCNTQYIASIWEWIIQLFFIRTILLEPRDSNFSWVFSKNYKELGIWAWELSRQSEDQEKHFKHVFGVGVGWEFEKIRIKIKNIRDWAEFTGSYKKLNIKESIQTRNFQFLRFCVFVLP